MEFNIGDVVNVCGCTDGQEFDNVFGIILYKNPNYYGIDFSMSGLEKGHSCGGKARTQCSGFNCSLDTVFPATKNKYLVYRRKNV